MAIRVHVRKNRLPEMAAQLPIAATQICGRRGQEMVEIAAARSRVDTGAMRDGWRWQSRGTAPGGSLVNDVPYTVHNEYGTVNMSAQPMARPAFEQVYPKILSDFRQLEKHLA